MKNTAVIFIFFLQFLSCFSQTGSLDTSFDFDGIVSTPIGSYVHGEALTLQADGKIIVGATAIFGSDTDITLLRYTANGSLDNSFGNFGVAHTDIISGSIDYCTAVAIQSDGKIVASGFTIDALSKKHLAIVRYNENGTLDLNFGNSGIIISQYFNTDTYGEDMIIQQDDKIVVVGTTKNSNSKNVMLAARYNPNGTLDTSFNTTGMITIDFLNIGATCNSVIQQNDGKLILAGSNYVTPGNAKLAIARLATDGNLDISFDSDGKQTSTSNACESFGLKIQNDDKIVVAGTIEINGSRDFIVARFNNDGSTDTSFSSDGFVTNNVGLFHDYCYTMTIENSGNILIAGATRMTQQANANFTILRYTNNGELDTTFNNNGIVITQLANSETIINSIMLQTDGKIIALGFKVFNNSTEIAMARYRNTSLNSIDFENMQNKIIVSPNPFSSTATITTNQNLLNATIYIYDFNGRLIKKINNVYGNTILMSGFDYSVGLYNILVLEQNHQIIKSSFVVK